MTNKAPANKINRNIIVLDASSSMTGHASDVIKVTDRFISELAGQVSIFPDQEWRITVYAFSSERYMNGAPFQCLIWDKDVLRVPSISGLYRPYGNTALCDTMLKVISDIKEIPVRYGDNTVLVMLVTDGQENASIPANRAALPGVVQGLPDTWTLAGLVPSWSAKEQLKRFGWAPGNVDVWDPTKEHAVEEVGVAMAAASTAYSGLRSRGQTTTDSLFSMKAPSKSTIQNTLISMTPGSFYFEHVTDEDLVQIERGRIDQFMALKTGKPYIPGHAYYQMTKRERIQHYKQVAVAIPDHNTKSVNVYVGEQARQALGLPASSEKREVRISPGKWKDYKVFVLSTSLNRRLLPDTSVLVMR